jgi:catechol 2,3-dioxygenase-like lactoylglutathione lyase family enzyme
MTIHSFEIISVPVSDQQRAKHFYRDVLGFELVREEAMDPGTTWIQLAPPGQGVTIALVTWFEQMKPGGLQGVMVNTKDIDAEHSLLRSRGLEIGEIKQEPWGRYAMFTDLDRNGWILRQLPAGADGSRQDHS